MAADGNQDIWGLRLKRAEFQTHYIRENHPGWVECTAGSYKQALTIALIRKLDGKTRLTEEELEQACLALNITEL